MARAGRKRKLDAERYPNGSVKPEEGPSPCATKRLIMASLAGMADKEWGSVAGIFYLSQRISEDEYNAARRFGDLHSQYLKILCGPKHPKTSGGERVSSSNQIDVDTEAGAIEAKNHIYIKAKYDEAHASLSIVGSSTEADVIRFCSTPGDYPATYDQMLKVRKGLRILAGLWKISKK